MTKKEFKSWFPKQFKWNGDCLEWQKSTNGMGYGRVWYDDGFYLTHRLAWMFEHGYMPEQLNHTCDNPLCANVEHLVDDDQKANVHDMYARGRNNNPVGEALPVSKLNEKKVRRARKMRAKGKSYDAIGKRFGVRGPTIRAVCLRETWKHVA